MVNRVEFTNFAKEKLKIIYAYYFEIAGEIPSKKLIKNIVNSTDRLIKYPESGKLENYKLNNTNELRSVRFKSYKLIYSIINEKIIVFNIFDMRQNPKLLEEEMKNL